MSCVIVSFSSRKSGNCEQISNFICSKMSTYKKYQFTEFIIHPCGNCHYECFQDNLACPYIEDMEYKLLEAICGSEMAYFVLPNYCDYPNANFFAFNERSQCFFQNHPERLEQYLNVPKKFVVVSNTGMDNFYSVLQQHSMEPEILFLSAKQYGKSSVNGTILESGAARADLERFIQNKP